MNQTPTLCRVDYHGKLIEWNVGADVCHVTDDGQIYPGKLVATTPDGLLKITYPNNEEGWERPETCYHG